eukprot:CAMPEP_0183307332 /NCGR_PEP_ID=MMETSP0160_2-20130417/17265_1 /TAXON_ID=2839 ORGANISM="Odontella Sinensis, Strain Grunow 1884" /NCGR_SAMPLE_ID=MMETSP0160_2 /ASSEMBLY_ACC=CAM_ASM_000250 /LENGTH=369 /DNA_ID=CAMNT_0025470895 /DNA_START=46 /DNA_END=1155 /DNA_ORIENTATION=+
MASESLSFKGISEKGGPEESPDTKKAEVSTTETSGAAAVGGASELDLVFVIDNTGSMSSWINNVQENVQKIIHEIVVSESCDVRLGLVSYRDHPPQDHSFVTQKHDFTSNISEMQNWVDKMRAQGGGDMPEAVADGLYDALHLSYRPNSTKVVVVVADAPPHGLGCCSDGFPCGCPSGHDPLNIVREMGEKGITIYAVICGNFEGQAFFQGISQMTGGQYVPLTQAHLLTRAIVSGAQEEIALERLMGEAQEVVAEEERAAGRDLNEEEVTEKLEDMFKRKGTMTRQTRFGGAELPDYEPAAAHYAKAALLSELRSAPTRDHLAFGSHGKGIDDAPAMRSADMVSGFGTVTSHQCKRMARKSKARGRFY